MGSAALWAAAQAGLRTIGLEQFGPAHDRGSSHGQTRIIRTAYFEHPSYVPLAQQSFQLWREIESASGVRLLTPTGLLQVGLPDSPVIQGVQASARQFGLPVAVLEQAEIERRWPAFRISPQQLGLFEESAGYLRVELCCAHLIRLAKQAGAEYRSGCRVTDWKVDDAGCLRLTTEDYSIRARQAIFAGGAWSRQLLADLNLPLEIVRKQQHWFQVDRADIQAAAGFCCFLFDTPSGTFYGFPAIDRLGMKVAEHTGGEPVGDPSGLNRELNGPDLQRVERFLSENFRLGRTRLTHFSPCMYTRSPDEHFLIDRHPRFPQIAWVAGLSGHGFKFAPVIGKQLVGLLIGDSNPDCEFLRLSRWGAAAKRAEPNG